MISIRTVNLLWEKKQRGVYAPSPFALDDDGTLAQAAPRPLEPRAYDFTLVKPDGGSDIRWGFSVETLLKLQISHANNCIGMTSDDLYLFRNRNKLKFLSEKHINYIDAALSEDGMRIAAAFSDLAGASFALAYGDIDGKLLWLREFDTQISSITISRDGTRVAAGVESGTLTLLDAARREVWSFELEEPICAVACSRDGNKVAYATAGGAVGLIGGDGARIWEASIRGDVVAMALSADASLCALLATEVGDTAGLAPIYCLMQDGSEGWQHDTDRRCTGISVSPNGGFLAIGSRDGAVSLFEIAPGEQAESLAGDTTDAALARAQELTEAGDPEQACLALKNALRANPADLLLHQEYLRIKQMWHGASIETGRQALAEGDARAAIRCFAAMLEEDPLCTDAARMLRRARETRAAQLIEEAAQLEADSDFTGADERLREAVAVAPADIPSPRTQLAALLEQRAAAIDTLAVQLQRDGDKEGALDSLLLAQKQRPKPERAARIRELQIEAEFAAGMQAYDAKRYNQAVFQFKKVLRLDKNNAESQRHLEFARRFAQETSTESLQDRFSRLE